MSLESNIEDLQPWMQAYIDRLSPTDRKHLLSGVGRKLRSLNKQRMMRQQTPDGSQWQGRRHSPMRHKVAGARIVFNYKGRNGTRNVAMKSYRDDGTSLIGYDLFTDQVRRFSKSKITNLRAGKRATARRRDRKMFVGARKRLRSVVLTNHIRVGWKDRTARILRHHHHGNSRTVQRELIGITDTDKQLLGAVILEYVEHG